MASARSVKNRSADSHPVGADPHTSKIKQKGREMANIPEGYELLHGRGRENARKAIELAEERGLDSSQVLVSTTLGGFLIPVPVAEAQEVEVVTEKNTVPEIDAFAEEWNIDLGEAKNKAEKIDAINAEIERRTVEAESTGELTGGIENKGE